MRPPRDTRRRAPGARHRLAGLLALLAGACAGPAPPPPAPRVPLEAELAGPYALVLGTAQDGGLPQIGCDGEACRAARHDPSRRRLVASLLLCDPRSGGRWLVDATPDLPEQVELARGHPPTRAALLADAGPRPPLFDGVLLTHAHVGHYAGLVHLGKEAYGARGLPLLVSARMADFLATNAPWSLMVATGAVGLVTLEPGEPVLLAPDLEVTAVAVPHRDELSDTLAFVVRGPERSLCYLPDVDAWERMREPSIEELVSRVDVALLDGTFFAAGEVPGRSLDGVPHPFLSRSLERFAAWPAAERAKVRFTHLNHTNPAAGPASAAAGRVREAGMRVAREGEVIDL